MPKRAPPIYPLRLQPAHLHSNINAPFTVVAGSPPVTDFTAWLESNWRAARLRCSVMGTSSPPHL